MGKEYEQDNAALRDVGRKLSPVRDSQALIEMFDELNGKYRDDLGDRSLVSIRDGLVKRNKSLIRELQQKRTRGAVLKTLRTFARRVDKWKVKEADLLALLKSFARTIRRNQHSCHTARRHHLGYQRFQTPTTNPSETKESLRSALGSELRDLTQEAEAIGE